MSRYSSILRSLPLWLQINRLHAQRIPVANARLGYLCKLALKYDEIELAAVVVSETASIDDTLRKKFWLKIIQQSKGIRPGSEFFKRSELLQIEDLSPFCQDFVINNDDCKEEYLRYFRETFKTGR